MQVYLQKQWNNQLVESINDGPIQKRGESESSTAKMSVLARTGVCIICMDKLCMKSLLLNLVLEPIELDVVDLSSEVVQVPPGSSHQTL